jgi:hypothetical protein
MDPYQLYMLSQGLGGGAVLAGAVSQYGAYAQRGRAERNLLRADAGMLEYQAEDAIRRGQFESYRVLHMARQMVGKQRVAYAASGVKVDRGSAAQVVEDTATLGALDAAMVESNAIREAFGIKTRAISNRLAYRSSKIQQRMGQVNSVLQGIAGAAQLGTQLNQAATTYGNTQAAIDGGYKSLGNLGRSAMRFW